MQIRKKAKVKLSSISMAIFIFAMIVRSFTAPYENAGLISQIKYVICIFGTLVSWEVIRRNKFQCCFRKELKKIWTLVFIFSIISMIYIVINHSFTSRTILELIYLAVPVTYAYMYVNSLPFEKIYKSMVVVLGVFLFGYLINLGMSFSAIISSISTISFIDSYSLLESSVYAAPSITLACFFLYYRSNKIVTLCSVLFVLLTFKRLSVIFAIVMLILPYFTDLSKPVKKGTIRFIKIVMFFLTIAYFYMMIPENANIVENTLNIDLNKITMGRAWRFKLLYHSSFKSAGLGSTYAYLMSRYNFALEMDMLRLIFEVSIIGVMLLINQFFDIVSKSRYCLMVMLYMFSNLLFSHSLADMFGWLLLYITFACVQYKHSESIGVKWKIR